MKQSTKFTIDANNRGICSRSCFLLVCDFGCLSCLSPWYAAERPCLLFLCIRHLCSLMRPEETFWWLNAHKLNIFYRFHSQPAGLTAPAPPWCCCCYCCWEEQQLLLAIAGRHSDCSRRSPSPEMVKGGKGHQLRGFGLLCCTTSLIGKHTHCSRTSSSSSSNRYRPPNCSSNRQCEECLPVL